jgi:hypothetical protein
MKTSLPFGIIAFLYSSVCHAQIEITPTSTSYTQNFNGLVSSGSSNTWTNGTTLTGWYSNKSTYSAENNGGEGTMYSFGTDASDRALGQITSQNNKSKDKQNGKPNDKPNDKPNGKPNDKPADNQSDNESVYFGVRFKNTTGSAIDKVFVSYTGEQWYKTSADISTLDFSYSVASTTDLSSGTYVDVDELDFSSPTNSASASTLDGNTSANKKLITAAFQLATPLADGSEIMLRWAIPNGNINGVGRQGLGVDDLTVCFGLNNNFDVPAGTIINSLNVDGFNVTPKGPLTVTGILTLTNGIVYSTATNLLTFNDGATAAGGSNASYVDGPVQKIGNDAFTFPVGDNGFYGTIAISAPTSTTDAFTAEYFRASATSVGSITPTSGLKNISGCEYWDLDRTSGFSNVNVTLSWDADNTCSVQGYNNDPSTVVIAHHDGSSWSSYGGSVAVNSTLANGSVTWSGVSSFSYFGLGSTAIFTVLPVHFAAVKVSEKSTGVQVEFTNLTESDVEYYEVERSVDGKAFSAVKKVLPVRNDYSSASYSWLDVTAKAGRYIYRIRAVETTGKIVFSGLAGISLGAKNSGLNVYAKGGQVAMQISSLPAGKYQVQVFSAAGQLLSVETINHAGGSLSQTKTLNNARTGVYILNISGAMQMQKRFAMQ